MLRDKWRGLPPLAISCLLGIATRSCRCWILLSLSPVVAFTVVVAPHEEVVADDELNDLLDQLLQQGVGDGVAQGGTRVVGASTILVVAVVVGSVAPLFDDPVDGEAQGVACQTAPNVVCGGCGCARG